MNTLKLTNAGTGAVRRVRYTTDGSNPSGTPFFYCGVCGAYDGHRTGCKELDRDSTYEDQRRDACEGRR